MLEWLVRQSSCCKGRWLGRICARAPIASLLGQRIAIAEPGKRWMTGGCPGSGYVREGFEEDEVDFSNCGGSLGSLLKIASNPSRSSSAFAMLVGCVSSDTKEAVRIWYKNS